MSKATLADTRSLYAEQEQGPSLSVIRLIHRGPDGYAPFAAKQAGEWRELGALSLSALNGGQQALFPELFAALERDGYFGLNSSFRRGRGRVVGTRQEWQPVPPNHPTFGNAAFDFPGAQHLVERPVLAHAHPETHLPYAEHSLASLRWLNVAHCDVDCYKAGLSVGDAFGHIVNAQDAGTLPPASLFARSGRGLWAFWLLRDVLNPADGEVELHGARHTAETPQRASARALALYCRVQRAIADRLAHLGADMGALDGARFAPVPGTVKTTTDVRVQYMVNFDADGSVISYTLTTLAQALQLELREREHPVVEAALTTAATGKHAGLSAAGKRGWTALHRYYLRDFEVLLRLRGGGFASGHRHRGLFLYAVVLKRNGMARFDVDARVLDVARRSQPDAGGERITDAEARAIVRDAFKSRTIPLNAASMFSALEVTDVEASYLQHIRRGAPAAPTTTRTTADRLAAIRAIVARLGTVPSTRTMAAYIKAQGLPGNFTTISRDYQKLGLQPVRKAGRPKKAPGLF